MSVEDQLGCMREVIRHLDEALSGIEVSHVWVGNADIRRVRRDIATWVAQTEHDLKAREIQKGESQ